MNNIFCIEDILKYAQSSDFVSNFNNTLDYLNAKNRAVFVTTSNRFQIKGKPEDIPKSTQIAHALSKRMKAEPVVIHADSLNIAMCEGNISRADGNSCGVKDSLLKDKDKNPSGNHRCWASINVKDDELWKITKPLFDSDCILFFGSIRWGQTNGLYQKIIERLSWIENINVTLKEKNIVKGIDAGLICTGHNWRGSDVIKIQKEVLSYFGFNTPESLFWNWQWTKNSEDEELQGYKKDAADFKKLIKLTVKGKNIDERQE